MELPPKLTITIEENSDIKSEDRRHREWCGSLIGAMAWLSNILGNAAYVFRGHADTAYVLDSSLKRLSGAASLKKLKEYELALLESVARDFWFVRMFGFDPATSRDHEDYERTIAALQHHGVPTRLLDFSADPLVALYFATIGDRRANDLDERDGEVLLLRAVPEPAELPFHVIYAPQISERVAAQRGRFLVHGELGEAPTGSGSFAFDFVRAQAANGSGTDFDALVDKYLTGDFQGRPAQKAPNALKFIIPAKLKPACRAVLKSMGVSARTLFPGDEGFRKDLFGF